MTGWPRGTADVALDYLRGRALGSELVAWSVRRLEDGCDTPSLVLLAGLDLRGPVTIFEAGPLFEAALGEMGAPLQGVDGSLRAWIVEIARDIADGSIEPQEALAKVVRRLGDPSDAPPELSAWIDLWHGLSPNGDPLSDAEIDAGVRALARAALGGS